MQDVIRKRPIHLFPLATLLSLFLLGIDVAITFVLTDPQQRLLYSDLASPVIGLLASAVLLIAAKRSASHSRVLAAAWGLIALATISFLGGDLSWAILELGLEEAPFPSVADFFYISYYPLLLVGVFLLPEQPASREEQIKKVLDMAIVMVAATLGFWNFLLGPILESNTGYSLLEQIILLAYPVGDIVLLWTLMRIIYKRTGEKAEDEAPAFLLAASIATMIIGDCIYTYQSLLGTYQSGRLLDVTWRATLLLTALAGVSQITTIQLKNSSTKLTPWLETLILNLKANTPYLVYVWLLAAYILLIRSRFAPLPMDFLSLSLGVGGIICLVFLRQIFTLSENSKLNLQLQQTMGRLQVQTVELERANQELQSEVMERRSVEQKLMYDSLHDGMTGLPNRVLFLDRLGQAIEYCKRKTEYTFAALFIDIDQFKVINDSLGHLIGDQLLISAGRRMQEALRSSDTIARFGGDEFAILLEITGEKDSASTVAEKIQETLRRPFILHGHELHVTASIGIVTDVVGYDSPEEVLRDADIAMYQAKASGKARFEIFNIQMRSRVFSRLEMEQQLRAALENHELELYYQPILAMSSNQLVSFEALIRWKHPQRGRLLPSEFLSIAEESGLILPMGKWVLREACAQLKKWHDQYPDFQHVSINVNIANRQFSQPNFVEELVAVLKANKLKPEALRLEITESVLISNYAAANEVFTKLRDLGIQLQIDDFGSGYSSLGYLQHFPISAVKIDKSFIDELGKEQRSVELVRAIISLARELGMETIAEGIETGEQFDQLRDLFCNFGQGFLLSEPLDEKAAEKIMETGI